MFSGSGEEEALDEPNLETLNVGAKRKRNAN